MQTVRKMIESDFSHLIRSDDDPDGRNEWTDLSDQVKSTICLSLGIKKWSNATAAVRVCTACPKEWAIIEQIFERTEQGELKGDKHAKSFQRWKAKKDKIESAKKQRQTKARRSTADLGPPPVVDIPVNMLERTLYSGVAAPHRLKLLVGLAKGELSAQDVTAKTKMLKNLTSVLTCCATVLDLEDWDEVSHNK